MNMATNTQSLIGRRQLQRENHRMVFVLAVIVALITAVSLMVPAISMTRGELVCGLEEHSHSASCYEQVLVCGLEEGDVVGESDDGEAIVHEHSAECYENQLVCDIPEHQHSDGCYAEPEPEADDDEVAAESEDDFSKPAAGDESAAGTYDGTGK